MDKGTIHIDGSLLVRGKLTIVNGGGYTCLSATGEAPAGALVIRGNVTVDGDMELGCALSVSGDIITEG